MLHDRNVNVMLHDGSYAQYRYSVFAVTQNQRLHALSIFNATWLGGWIPKKIMKTALTYEL